MQKKQGFWNAVLLSPHVLWTLIFIVAPLAFVAYYAFTDADGAFTIANVVALGDHMGTFGLSVCFALIATVICLLIAYPMAYFLCAMSARSQKVLVMLAMLPMWMNLLIRTYSMLAIFDDAGFLNRFIWTFAPNFEGIHIIGTPAAVIFGMVYNFFPYMLLPLYSVMSRLDGRLIEAAQDLGCTPVRVITRVVMPLTKSGIISGITMVFVPSISTFYISQKLGGGTFDLIGDAIERQFQRPDTYSVGAAISLVMMILILISIAVMNRFGDADGAKGGGMVL